MLTTFDRDELDLGADEINVGRKQIETRQGGVNDRPLGRLAPQQGMVDRRVKALLLDSKSRGGIALRIEVGEEGWSAREGETGGQVDRRRRLSYTTLLVDDSQRLTQVYLLCSTSNMIRSARVEATLDVKHYAGALRSVKHPEPAQAVGALDFEPTAEFQGRPLRRTRGDHDPARRENDAELRDE
jgi:hypothetical protein